MKRNRLDYDANKSPLHFHECI